MKQRYIYAILEPLNSAYKQLQQIDQEQKKELLEVIEETQAEIKASVQNKTSAKRLLQITNAMASLAITDIGKLTAGPIASAILKAKTLHTGAEDNLSINLENEWHRVRDTINRLIGEHIQTEDGVAVCIIPVDHLERITVKHIVRKSDIIEIANSIEAAERQMAGISSWYKLQMKALHYAALDVIWGKVVYSDQEVAESLSRRIDRLERFASLPIDEIEWRDFASAMHAATDAEKLAEDDEPCATEEKLQHLQEVIQTLIDSQKEKAAEENTESLRIKVPAAVLAAAVKE